MCENKEKRRLNILVSAFAFSPYQGSERGVGWNVVTRLAKYHDVTVLYGDVSARQQNRLDVERWFQENEAIEGLRCEYVKAGFLARFFDSLSRIRPLLFLYYSSYRCWQYTAYRHAKKLLKQQPFDLVHHLTFISYREPGYLWKLDIPFFWGPINGADDIPLSYMRLFSMRAKARYLFRNAINSLQKNGSRSVRKAAAKASVIWVVTDADHQMVTQRWGASVERLSETGLSSVDHAKCAGRDTSSRSVRLVWSGTLEGRKALPLLLEAIASLKTKVQVELTVLGDGPERVKWQVLSKTLGIEEHVRWRGRVPHAEAQQIMAEADIFIFTSVKEASSTVVMEALAYGLPVICHDACGMKYVVDDTCGIKVPMKNPETSIKGFAEAIQRLVEQPELIQELSKGALDKAELFSWDSKARAIADTYISVLPGETER